jgi:predicted nucleic acid-binding protein
MALVTDASAFLCLVFKDEGLSYGASVVDAVRDDGGVVPAIFWYEVRNALVVNERRGRISVGQTTTFLGLLSGLPLSIEPLPPESGVLQIARKHGLSVYDASYLELSSRLGLPLATLDETLRAAAVNMGDFVWSPPTPAD